MKITKVTGKELSDLIKDIPPRAIRQISEETEHIRKELESLESGEAIKIELSGIWNKSYNKDFSNLQTQTKWANDKLIKNGNGKYILFLSTDKKIATVRLISNEDVDKFKVKDKFDIRKYRSETK